MVVVVVVVVVVRLEKAFRGMLADDGEGMLVVPS